ncbi:HAD-IIA family hydrolase [Metabacillus malikii]|uniref:Acid sugar phosphatase n=1 Tax=Metabacillus malikii TaxID=1504265 RepID=A0ABT9ZKW4_9BACI|nr:HAD-IIA family hydrolase [Metabacillus malikii]MDQ0232158.1 HAD superfamily hydrolase (TIGR01450 family) [Metabacillus malikii]
MIHIDDFAAYCFDLDGTIYVGKQLLPGVKETIHQLRQQQKHVLFITNSPTQTRSECKQRLQELGILSDIEEILTAPYVAARYFLKCAPNATIYIVGERSVEAEFGHYQLRTTREPLHATHVLVGLDREFTYEKLNCAMNAVRNGAKLIVTNPDQACPVPGGFIADTLSIARAIEVAAEQTISDIIGKPSVHYGDLILEKLKIPKELCLIIGDRLETDILLGKTMQMATCLVLTGASSIKDIDQTGIRPDYVLDNLSLLFKNSIHI